jgi:DNA-binding response OmpR family regulator
MPTILVVEDDQSFGYAAAKYLEYSGYEVLVASGTMSALRILDAPRHIDLCLIDISMPEGQPHGIAFGRMARMKRPGIKTAFMTSFRDLGIHAEEMGVVFTKPLDMEFLTTSLGALLRDPDPSANSAAK